MQGLPLSAGHPMMNVAAFPGIRKDLNVWGSMPIPLSTSLGTFSLEAGRTYFVFYATTFFATAAPTTVGTRLLFTVGAGTAVAAIAQIFMNNANVHTATAPEFIMNAGTVWTNVLGSGVCTVTQDAFGGFVAVDTNDIISVLIFSIPTSYQR